MPPQASSLPIIRHSFAILLVYVSTGLVVIYWTFAFILCAAIPQIAALGAFISALAGLQFTYVRASECCRHDISSYRQESRADHVQSYFMFLVVNLIWVVGVNRYVLPPLMLVAFLWRKANLEKRTNEIVGIVSFFPLFRINLASTYLSIIPSLLVLPQHQYSLCHTTIHPSCISNSTAPHLSPLSITSSSYPSTRSS